MVQLKPWVVTYGTTFDEIYIPYWKLCDTLGDKTIEALKKEYDKVAYAEDSRDGETYSIRLKIYIKAPPIANPPSVIPVEISDNIYEMELLEFKEEEAVYPRELDPVFNKMYECLSDYEVPFADLALRLLSEAIICYNDNIYEAAVILCRTAIDSSIHLSCLWRRNGDHNFVRRSPDPFIGIKHLGFYDLRKKANELHILNLRDSQLIDEQVRKLGNFAAHISEGQLKEEEKWREIYTTVINEIQSKASRGERISLKDYPPGYKLYTSKGEASAAILKTMSFLCRLAKNYKDCSQ